MSAKFHDKREKDLFDHLHASEGKRGKKTIFFIPRIKKSTTLSYENIIFIAIGFVMSCIIFFSLGVEKGRQDVGHVVTEKREENIEQSRDRERDKRDERREDKAQEKYIIQIAAFKKRGSAEQERSRLLKEGYSANIKRSGDYYQLYVGGFDKEKTAQKLLKELKQKYIDSYIKKL
ncbi:SPOR domain-containing protein [Candidatus Omnitrophota bacterium]